MSAISKETGSRIESGIYCVSDQTGRQDLIIHVHNEGMRVLNGDLVLDYIPSSDFVGGDISTPCLKLRIRGKKDTWFPVKES